MLLYAWGEVVVHVHLFRSSEPSENISVHGFESVKINSVRVTYAKWDRTQFSRFRGKILEKNDNLDKNNYIMPLRKSGFNYSLTSDTVNVDVTVVLFTHYFAHNLVSILGSSFLSAQSLC